MTDEVDEEGVPSTELPALDVDDLRVPVVTCQAEIALMDGTLDRVTLYLAPNSSVHPGGELVDEFLQSDRGFVPMRSEARGAVLINRRAIISLRVDKDAPTFLLREEVSGGEVEMVCLVLLDKRELRGSIRTLGPSGRRRVSDVLNEPDRFLPVETADHVVYVNKLHVLRVVL